MNDMQSTLQVGHFIRGRYKVIDLLGQGVSGAVYLVTDERVPEKQFVLKEVVHVVHEQRRELPFNATALKQLQHPALPRVYRVFSGDNRTYILMEYIQGSNLKVMRQLMPGKRLSLHAAMTLMSPIMDAVSYMHQQHPHQVHGDIKPANIIAPIAGVSTTSKLVDLGGIRELGARAQQDVINFRAPEQFGKRASRRSDVYALGAVFYTLLTGTIPVSAPERVACINAGEPDPLWPLSQITPFAQVVAQAIHQAMAISRHDRFVSVEQFREALWQVMHSDRAAARVLDLTVAVPGEEQALSGSNILETDSLELMPFVPGEEHMDDDDEMLYLPPSALFANGPVTPMPPSFASAITPPESVPLLGETVILQRRRRRSSGRAGDRQRRRERKKRLLFVLATIFLLVCVVWSGVGILGYQKYNATYQNEGALAKVGLKHLQTAAMLLQAWSKKPLDAPNIATAQHEFAAASATFTQITTDLHPYSGVGVAIPGLGSRLSTALRIASAATAISQAGVIGCEALALITARFRYIGNGLTIQDLAMLRGKLHLVEAEVSQATMQINALQPADLQFDSRVANAVAAFHRYLPSVQTLLYQTEQLLPALPPLLGIGAPAYYLVEILDPTELRPGGGAIKDYGFATFGGGRLSGANISDVNLLDSQSAANGSNPALPSTYKWFLPASQGWNLRDSNLDADFPTAAKYAEQNYISEHGRVDLRGVIAITPTLMAQALGITGSIRIPELRENISSQNLIDRLHYYQFGPGSRAGNVLISPGAPRTASRYFTQLLAQGFLKRVQQLPVRGIPELLQLLSTALRTKDLQVYFNNPAAENLLQLSHTASTILTSTGDNLFLVDANTADSTANQFITGTLNDQVTIDGNGNATHHATVRYPWLKSGSVIGSSVYSDYARVYVPTGSVLKVQQGWQPRGTDQAFDHEVWAGSFDLSYGQTLTVTLSWTEKGVAKHDAAGWHYQYLIQRQAGTSWTMNVGITLPSCAAQIHTTGGLVAHGQTATLSQRLYEDTPLGIDYSC